MIGVTYFIHKDLKDCAIKFVNVFLRFANDVFATDVVWLMCRFSCLLVFVFSPDFIVLSDS